MQRQRVRVELAAAAVLLAGSNADAQPTRPRYETTPTRVEAINLLQGADSLPFIDTTRVALVSRALFAARRDVPQVADIDAGPDHSFLVLFASDRDPSVFIRRSGATRPAGADSLYWETSVSRTGVRALDSLNKVFGVSRVVVRSFALDQSQLLLYFQRPVNVSVVANAYRKAPEVDYAGAEIYTGDGNRIGLVSKGRRLLFVFARGGGDCPAGCTERDFYYVAYDTLTRRAQLEHQLLHPAGIRNPGVDYWDVPGNTSILLFSRVDAILAAMRDERWWHRAHAVRVLRMILGTAKEPWPEPDSATQTRFTSLRAAALVRRRDTYAALVDRLADTDSDVASLALRYLRELTGQQFGGGAAGIAEWRRWLNANS